jgi:hypothetical protein
VRGMLTPAACRNWTKDGLREDGVTGTGRQQVHFHRCCRQATPLGPVISHLRGSRSVGLSRGFEASASSNPISCSRAASSIPYACCRRRRRRLARRLRPPGSRRRASRERVFAAGGLRLGPRQQRRPRVGVVPGLARPQFYRIREDITDTDRSLDMIRHVPDRQTYLTPLQDADRCPPPTTASDSCTLPRLSLALTSFSPLPPLPCLNCGESPNGE